MSDQVRGRFLFREVNERGFDLPLGSVTKVGGVEFRSDLDISVWNPGDDTSGYKRVLPGDFVIGLRSFQSGIGHSSIETIVSPAYTVLRPVSDRVHVGYFKHLFKSDVYISRLENVAQGIRQGRTIATEDFYNIECPVPPLTEQRAIAAYLDAETARIDALIAKKQQLIHLLEERWGSELTELLRLGGNQVALQRLFEPTIGGSWGSEPGTADVDATCVRGTDFDMATLRVGHSCPRRGYTYADLGSKSLRPGDLVIEKSGGGDNQPVGRVVLFEGAGPAIPTNFAARLRPIRGHSPAYLALLLNAAYRLGITRSWIKQTTGIQNLDLGGLLSEKVPMPRLAVQHELLGRLAQSEAQLRSTCRLLARQVSLIAEHRQALVTAALTGDCRVRGTT